MKYSYLYLWTVSLIFLVLSFLQINKTSNFVINYNDTYAVISKSNTYKIIAATYLISSILPIITTFFKLAFKNWQVQVHVLGSIAILIIVISGIYIIEYIAGTKTVLQQAIEGFNKDTRIRITVFSGFCAFVFLQIVFAIQITMVFFKKI